MSEARPQPRILVVEDDPKIASSVELYLRDAAMDVDLARDGQQALDLAGERRYDLVLLDLLLPEVDGFEVCTRLRSQGRVPIIMLTARTSEDDRVRGLELGADDYVPKPFSPRELVARVRAVLRRTREMEAGEDELLRHGDLVVDRYHHEVRRAGEVVNLTPSEFRILEVLVSQPGRVLSREQLIEQALGLGYDGSERTVDVHVKNLRKKLESDRSRPDLIRTVFGVGYSFGG